MAAYRTVSCNKLRCGALVGIGTIDSYFVEGLRTCAHCGGREFVEEVHIIDDESLGHHSVEGLKKIIENPVGDRAGGRKKSVLK